MVCFQASWSLSRNIWIFKTLQSTGGLLVKRQTWACWPPISSFDIRGRTEDFLLLAVNHLVTACAGPLFGQKSHHGNQNTQRIVFRRNCSIDLPLMGFPCQSKGPITLPHPGFHHHRMALHIASLHVPTHYHWSLLTFAAFRISKQVFWGFVSLGSHLDRVWLT